MTAPLPVWLRAGPDGVTVAVAAQPNAKRSEVVGVHGDALKVKVASPAVDGAANEALIAFVAATVGVRLRDVSLLRGASSRQKVLLIKGVTADAVAAALAPPAAD